MNKRIKSQAKRMADAIVELVERKGAVTFVDIEREVAGFSDETSVWQYSIEWDNGIETVIWQNMTDAGLAALKAVLSDRRVAVEITSPLLYLLQERLPDCEHWLPLMLLPAQAANVDTPRWLMRAPQHCLDTLPSNPELQGRYRLLNADAVQPPAHQ